MSYVVVFVFIFTVIYLYRLLSTSSGSEFEDNSIDAFIISTDDAEENGQSASFSKDKYKLDYTEEGKQILILYGTEYGCSEEIAKLLFDRIKDLNEEVTELPHQPRLISAKHYHIVDFTREQLCFIVISTSGDGVPPTDAREFAEYVSSASLDLHHLRYSVLALGDSNYSQFCKTGRLVHSRFQSLGAECVISQQDVDMEDWNIINCWIDRVTDYLKTADLRAAIDYIQHGDITEESFSRNRPFMATLKTKYALTVCDTDDDKETIHCEFDISGSGLTWTSGDALGIYPQNNPCEVKELLAAMNCSGEEKADIPSWAYQETIVKNDYQDNLFSILKKYYDLKSIKLDLFELLKENVTDSEQTEKLNNILTDDILLQTYAKDREVADILLDFTSNALPFREILKCMKSLQPRYYSISSSPKVNDSMVCVTAAVVRYQTLNKPRTGVTTTYLQDRLNIGEHCLVFISRNPDFRLPADAMVPVILIGPGTGLAPFMAFIQERAMINDRGPTWLYFGCRHQEKDYLYHSQLEKWAENGIIKLSVAFSRDQVHKVYVQDLIRKDANQIWQLINNENASLFVCGDAKHMAHDVHNTLKEILMDKGIMDEKNAASYLKMMEDNQRYQKDVWVV